MTSPTAIDEQIAKLEARRAEAVEANERAHKEFDEAATALEDGVAASVQDVDALRVLPDLLRDYTKACRNFHRVVNGQRLRRRNHVVAGPIADLTDPALD